MGGIGQADGGELGISERGHETARRNVIDIDAITATTGRELPVFGERDGQDGIERRRFLQPVHRRGGADFTLAALLDPELEQCELVRREIGGVRLVVLGRHDHLGIEMRGSFEDEAGRALAGHKSRTGIATLEDELRCFEVEAGLGLGGVVAGEATVLEEGQNLLLEIHRSVALEFGDGQRGARRRSSLALRREGGRQWNRRREQCDRQRMKPVSAHMMIGPKDAQEGKFIL